MAFIFYYVKLDTTKEININLNFDIKDIINDPFCNIKDSKIKKSIMDTNKNLGKNFINLIKLKIKFLPLMKI